MLRSDNSEVPKLLILYASYGEGHLQAARAIRDALEERGNYRTVMVDLMAESHPWLNEMTRRVYLKSYTHMPGLYGWVYGLTRPMKHNSLLGGILHSFGREKIRRILAEEQPDAVIHTFPAFALPALQRSIRRRSSGLRKFWHIPPSYAVITDFDLHQRWVHPSIDRYYVATDDLRQELGKLGIRAERVHVSGIPLKRGFSCAIESSLERYKLHERYGLAADKPIVLLMAGAQGVMPDTAKLCASLLEQHTDVQLAVVCGHNRLLYTSLEQQFIGHPFRERLRLFEYVDQMHELMAIATILVTKPGGITLAEAIAAGLPIFIYRPVPGQEKRNAQYLQSKGAAVISYGHEDLTARITQFLASPERLKNSLASISRLQQAGSAAETIAGDILSNLQVVKPLLSTP